MMNTILKQAFELSGVGLHSGITTTVKVTPASLGKGRYFIRIDLPDKPKIPATVNAVSQTTLSTELAAGEAKVRTVEHLLAALSASGINDACIEIDGAEVPLLDGSAKVWVEAIKKAGMVVNEPQLSDLQLLSPIVIQEQDSFVAAIPAAETRFTYGIDFPYKAIANQWHSWHPTTEDFATEIAPARTFGFAEQIEQLKQAGLIKGGNLDNALVCSHEGWLNPPLRFTNEPARHKLLDLVGDLSLLGSFPQAHFIAYKASHKLHIELAKKLLMVNS
ncbi:UDP-3-O-acyl-N-acetylglucosamine deacetylase [Hyella patelloides LEGE 07179]|uniref:UDP-3-O-acyl-N-acetylglucosamine deacetylase n=1 Tax=Hyella patelloides LEGE 07179 TaxID=945734 RepID=A0A563VVC1_9CYAN|nr:UDP-3-O-acyl-N-acetylglucosamine deacetylase [Hyella patelloides]VEP15355.1 UDP-3-O-acyl-N-acetylglucosamine deacetylase [Hyella patelloides LEGE 07179]